MCLTSRQVNPGCLASSRAMAPEVFGRRGRGAVEGTDVIPVGIDRFVQREASGKEHVVAAVVPHLVGGDDGGMVATVLARRCADPKIGADGGVTRPLARSVEGADHDEVGHVVRGIAVRGIAADQFVDTARNRPAATESVACRFDIDGPQAAAQVRDAVAKQRDFNFGVGIARIAQTAEAQVEDVDVA